MTPNPADIICPECSAANPADAVHCAQCGRRLISHGQAANVWSRPIAAASEAQTNAIDPTPVSAKSSQATTPISGGDWNDGGAQPRASISQPEATWGRPPAAPVKRKPGGPPSWVLGCLGIFIVLIVAAIFGGMVGRAYIRGQADDRIKEGITTQVGAMPNLTVNAGTLTLTDAEINRQIKSFTGSLDPISDPVASLDREGIHITFDVLGRSSKFSGQPIVRDGKIVILNPAISGPARFIVDADSISSIAEEQLAALMTRSNITPKSIVLSQGALTVITTDSTGNTV